MMSKMRLNIGDKMSLADAELANQLIVSNSMAVVPTGEIAEDGTPEVEVKFVEQINSNGYSEKPQAGKNFTASGSGVPLGHKVFFRKPFNQIPIVNTQAQVESGSNSSTTLVDVTETYFTYTVSGNLTNVITHWQAVVLEDQVEAEFPKSEQEGL